MTTSRRTRSRSQPAKPQQPELEAPQVPVEEAPAPELKVVVPEVVEGVCRNTWQMVHLLLTALFATDESD